MDKNNENIYWYNNPKILYDKWYDFVPNNEKKYYDNINSIIRFLIYSIILLIIYGGNINFIILLILLLVVIHIIGLNKYDDNQIILNSVGNDSIKKVEIKCRKSTINNPMSNILITMDPEELAIPACDEKVNTDKLVDDNINYNTYTNSNKMYNKNFYIQMNNTIHPNNKKQFQDYLYDLNSNNCKYDSKKCTAWNDVKFYRAKLY